VSNESFLSHNTKIDVSLDIVGDLQRSSKSPSWFQGAASQKDEDGRKDLVDEREGLDQERRGRE